MIEITTLQLSSDALSPDESLPRNSVFDRMSQTMAMRVTAGGAITNEFGAEAGFNRDGDLDDLNELDGLDGSDAGLHAIGQEGGGLWNITDGTSNTALAGDGLGGGVFNSLFTLDIGTTENLDAADPGQTDADALLLPAINSLRDGASREGERFPPTDPAGLFSHADEQRN